MTKDEKELRRVLDLARADVYRGHAHLALGHLRSVQLSIDDLAGTSFWAEYQLTYAGALAAMVDPGADAAFGETFERISELSEPDAGLEVRAHEDYARYLAGNCLHSAACKHYQSAESIALDAGLSEDAARIHLCIVRIDLQRRHDPRLGSLQNLKQAGKDAYTAQEQLAAWIQYCEDIEDRGREMVAARNGGVASVDYFRGLLSSVRRTLNESTV